MRSRIFLIFFLLLLPCRDPLAAASGRARGRADLLQPADRAE